MKKQLLGSAAALLMTVAGASVAHASVFAGTATFTDLTTGNALNVAAYPNPDPFTTTNLSTGTSEYITGFMTLTTNDTQRGNGFCLVFCTGVTNTDTIALTIAWSQPSTASNTTVGGNVAETTFSLAPSFDYGQLVWAYDIHHDSNGTYAQQTVTFADGAIADIDLYDSRLTGTTSSEAAQFDMRIRDIRDPAQVPEPMSASLLGAGLIGIGAICRRKSSSTPTVV